MKSSLRAHRSLKTTTKTTAKKSPVVIRHARRSDLPHLCELLRQLWPDQPRDPKALQKILKIMMRPGHQDDVFVATMCGAIVGMMTLSWKPSLFSTGWLVQIEQIVVTEALRGHGVGTTLLQFGVHHARKLKAQRVTLNAGFHRLKAHHFYERHGFQKFGYHFGKML